MSSDSVTSLGQRIAQLIHQYLLWFLIAAYVIAAVIPGPGLWIRKQSFGELPLFGNKLDVSLLLLLLAILMFNAGLGVRASQLRCFVQQAGVVIAGIAANVLIPMAYVFIVTLFLNFWHNPEEAQHILVGLALVAAMPIAGASTAWSQNSNGNLALSLGLVLVSTLLSPLVTPIAFQVFGEMASEEYEQVLDHVASYGSGAFLGLWVVLPSLLGVGTRLALPPAWLNAVNPFIKVLNSVVLLLLNYSNASVSLPKALAERDLDFLAVTMGITAGLCVTAFAAGDRLSRYFNVDQDERISLMYGLGMNNNGTGLVLASLALGSYPRVMVPIIFYNLVQHLVAGAVHQALGRQQAVSKAVQKSC
jgi:BASS family bile acid:Na+ symporter